MKISHFLYYYLNVSMKFYNVLEFSKLQENSFLEFKLNFWFLVRDFNYTDLSISHA